MIPKASLVEQALRQKIVTVGRRLFDREHRALLLRQHGSLTYGSSLDEACDHLERMEHAARVFWMARSLVRVQRLPPALMARLDAYRGRAGVEGEAE
jgi:ribulose-5-phosphate 4-epimerase/fuculose-1-phosphate aldolase